MGNKRLAGHLAALLTIIIWGTTFISTKVLLTDFKPVEILFFRFVMGFAALLLACPHRMKGVGRRQELTFVLAGLCGICLYYLLENIALTYTMASNVGVIISVALISFNGFRIELNPMGDLLAVFAAFVWACYSILTRKISSFGYPVILTTRRTFFYGILFMVPALFLFDFEIGLERFADVAHLLNILYLGLGASALCFVTWNLAVKVLGAVKTSVYIYMVPVITVVISALVLKESVTWGSVTGTVLAVAGLFFSEYSGKGSGNSE